MWLCEWHHYDKEHWNLYYVMKNTELRNLKLSRDTEWASDEMLKPGGVYICESSILQAVLASCFELV